MFYIYSMLSYLADMDGKIDNYWGQSGTMDLLGNLMTPNRALRIGEALRELGASFTAAVHGARAYPGPRPALWGLEKNFRIF